LRTVHSQRAPSIVCIYRSKGVKRFFLVEILSPIDTSGLLPRANFFYCFLCLPTILKIRFATNATTASAMSHSPKEKTPIIPRIKNSSKNAIAIALTVAFVLRTPRDPELLLNVLT